MKIYWKKKVLSLPIFTFRHVFYVNAIEILINFIYETFFAVFSLWVVRPDNIISTLCCHIIYFPLVDNDFSSRFCCSLNVLTLDFFCLTFYRMSLSKWSSTLPKINCGIIKTKQIERRENTCFWRLSTLWPLYI